MFTCVYILHRLNPLPGTKLGFFPVCFSVLLAGSSFWRKPWNDDVAACSTALRSAIEKNEMGGYVTVPGSSKMTQCSSTKD